MNMAWKTGLTVFVVLTLLSGSACGRPIASYEERPETVQRIAHDAPKHPSNTLRRLETNDAVPLEGQSFIPLVTDGETYYVPLLEMIDILGYQYDWDEASKTYLIGDRDPIYEIRMNSAQAVKDGVPLTLPKQTVLLNGVPYLPLEGFQQLFQGEANYTVQGSRLIFHAQEVDVPKDINAEVPVEEGLDFGDDPEDPAADEEVWIPAGGDPLAEPVLKNIDMNRLVSTAKQYLGVKYKFGARPYSASYRYFDCSSYTRHVFGKYGVSLPRTARAQANRGVSVSRNKLRKGDLLFFYVPGRFKTNKTPGHVGIYIGNNRIIHASPEATNGVQITNINKAYWKKTFLKARRVAY